MHLSSKTLEKSQHYFGENVNEENKCASNVDKIEKEISYDEFYRQYLVANRPCILGNWSTKNWKSVRLWVKDSEKECMKIPNFRYLEQEFGEAEVPVADCKQRYYSSQQKETWLFKEYLKYWVKYKEQNYPNDQKCLYLKDWHFAREFKGYGAYETPVYFQSDWLNEYWDVKTEFSGDDYRFVYMGPKGSWTPFHADVYRSFSWSANICGRKKWTLYPPGNEEYLKDMQGELPYDVTLEEVNNRSKYPNAHLAGKPFVVTQEAGEIIFVPSGWHHQVFNLEDTISINHNWLNACNVGISWQFLLSELDLVKREIRDLKDLMPEREWLSQSQKIMKANSGIDFKEFIHFLKTISVPRKDLLIGKPHVVNSNSCQVCQERRLSEDSARESSVLQRINAFLNQLTTEVMKEACEVSLTDKKNPRMSLCFNHLIFDLCMVLKVLDKFLQNHDTKLLDEEDGRSLHDCAYELFCDVYKSLGKLVKSDTT